VLLTLWNEAFLAPDVAQYTSVAKNILIGNGIYTDIIVYEQQYKTELLPAPQTVFPPGYPLLIALISLFGISSIDSVFLVSALSFSLIPIILYKIARKSGFDYKLSILTGLSWLFIGFAWVFTLGGLSEISFVFFTLTSVYCLLEGCEVGQKQQLFWILVAAVFASFAFLVRYTGIFYILSVCILLTINSFLNRNSIRNLIVFCIVTFITIAVLFMRNYFVIGTYSGGPELDSTTSLIGVIKHLYWATGKLFGFYDNGIMSAVIQLSLILVLVSSLIILSIRIKNIGIKLLIYKKGNVKNICGVLAGIYLLVTLIALAYLGIMKDEDYMNYRYIFPILPFAFILLMYIYVNSFYSKSNTSYTIQNIVVVIISITLLFGQIRTFIVEYKEVSSDNRHSIIKNELKQKINNESLLEFLQRTTNVNHPIISTNGQFLYLLLERPILDLTPSKFTNTVWTSDVVERVVKKYQVKYIVFFHKLFEPMHSINKNKKFFVDLKNNRQPSWLNIIYDKGGIRLYKVNY